MSKWSIIGVVIVVACATAVAGKRERELMTRDAIPAARAAEANFKASCECELSIALDASLQSEDEITFATYIAQEVSRGAAHYCTDADSRKALCRMKLLKIAAASQSTFTFDDGVGVATTNGRGHVTWDMITRALDR
jgi:hypothetical protein